MTSFETTAVLGIRIPDQETRAAKEQIEESIGTVSIPVEADGSVGSQGPSTASLAGGAGVVDELGDQTDLLRGIHQELEKIGVSGGGSGGGGGSLFGGTSGVAIGSMLGGGGGGLLGTVLGKGKSVLGSLLKGRGGIKGLLGRSPFTIIAQTAGERNVGPRSGGAGGPVTSVMGDIATGEFQLKEDFWPDLSPPDNLWGGLTDTLSPPDNLWGFDLSPPQDLWGFDLSPPEDLWGIDVSPPDDLWSVDLSPPDDLWGIDLSPPDNLWGIDLSPPANLWNIDLSPPDDLWGFDLSPPDGFWSNILPGQNPEEDSPDWGNAPGSGKNQPQSDNTPESQQKNSYLTATYGDYDPNQGPSQTSTSTSSSSSPGSEPRVDVQIQEIRAEIRDGRTLEDALRAELENVTPEIKDEVVSQIRDDMPNRL